MKSSLMSGGHARTVTQKDLNSIRGAVSILDATMPNMMTITVDTGTKEGRQKAKHIMRRSMTEAM
eukprot:5281162-Heterocapsa_arctica.AAC.1